ncbi:MAG: Flp pilus assembly protein CpaB [Planctomycetota bacterium]
MRAKSMVLILLALGCGLVAATAISQVTKRGSGSGGDAMEMVQIYVASADIDVNEQLEADNVKVEDWPKSKAPEGGVTDFEQIKEKFARVRFYKGEPILKTKLAGGIEGAAIKIPEGFRVCSFKVQMDTAVSGLVNPGDRVDIVGYFSERAGAPQTGTREILRNVRVFAVNSETEFEKDPEGRTIVAKTVSVLVEHRQVARLMLASELGTLRLALRRPDEATVAEESEAATVDSLFGLASDDADKEQTAKRREEKSGTKLTSAAGGFVKFLSQLKQDRSGNENGNAMVPGALASLPAGGAASAWQMQVLTPRGGTSFVWDDENQLPRQDDGRASATPAGQRPMVSTPPVQGQGHTPATPDTMSAEERPASEEESLVKGEDEGAVEEEVNRHVQE